jgi:hypothetical protein
VRCIKTLKVEKSDDTAAAAAAAVPVPNLVHHGGPKLNKAGRIL